ncbi:MAG: T9SS type A sorting domain-containing protein, partial [Bacteroidales bacterium]|nr:T9SS type A sorting domain-containing protein [Bacteroidales bacterium]
SNRWPVLDWMPGAGENILVGFNLYRDETALGRFWLDDMRLTYVDDKIDELGTYTYKLEVVYEDGCVATETKDITLTGKGEALAPFGLTLDAEDNNSTCNVKATWETPMFEEPLALRYCNAVTLNAVTFDKYYECWAAIGWDTANLGLYKDLHLVGMEYLIGAMPKTFEGFVILNNEMVHVQPITRPIARDWQTVLFDKSFPMNQPHEVAVGYHTTYTAENVGVLTVDESVSKTGYSDLITLDGQQWSTLKAGGKKGSWCISALVVHKRDLDAAQTADGSIDRAKLEGSLMRMAINQPLNAQATTLPETFTVKPSAKEGLNLIGFNLYRRPDAGGDDVKLNDELLTTFEWTDLSVPKEEMLYTIGAVYADGQEIKTEKYIDLTRVDNEGLASALTLNLYPNPTTDVLNIDGEYETLQILDMGGRLLRTHKAVPQVQLNGLKPGTYFFQFTDAAAHKAVYKVVVR